MMNDSKVVFDNLLLNYVKYLLKYVNNFNFFFKYYINIFDDHPADVLIGNVNI